MKVSMSLEGSRGRLVVDFTWVHAGDGWAGEIRNLGKVLKSTNPKDNQAGVRLMEKFADGDRTSPFEDPHHGPLGEAYRMWINPPEGGR
jgi:hypothetical protein